MGMKIYDLESNNGLSSEVSLLKIKYYIIFPVFGRIGVIVSNCFVTTIDRNFVFLNFQREVLPIGREQ